MNSIHPLFAALRGAATLKARALKEVWNIATVLPAEKGTSSALCGQVDTKHSDSSFSGELPMAGEDFLGVCNQELLAKGTELLKRTRGGTPKVTHVLNTCKLS